MPLTDRMDRLTRQKQAALEKAKAADPQLRKLRSEQDRAILQGGKILEAAKMLQWDPSTLLGSLLEINEQAEKILIRLLAKQRHGVDCQVPGCGIFQRRKP